MEAQNDPQGDRALMERAVELARPSVIEPGRVSPRVGAVVGRDGVRLGEAFWGELGQGEHAEFTLLERKLADETLDGAKLRTKPSWPPSRFARPVRDHCHGVVVQPTLKSSSERGAGGEPTK